MNIENALQNAPITGNIMNIIGQVGVYPKRNPGFIISKTPIKQESVNVKCILCKCFLWYIASKKCITIGPILNKELIIPRGNNGTVPRNSVRAEVLKTDLFINNEWNYLFF